MHTYTRTYIGNCCAHFMSCKHTCSTTQHYNAFRCFIVTAMKTHDNKADLMLSNLDKTIAKVIVSPYIIRYTCDY